MKIYKVLLDTFYDDQLLNQGVWIDTVNAEIVADTILLQKRIAAQSNGCDVVHSAHSLSVISGGGKYEHRYYTVEA